LLPGNQEIKSKDWRARQLNANETKFERRLTAMFRRPSTESAHNSRINQVLIQGEP
jgi:hypothetical protein